MKQRFDVGKCHCNNEIFIFRNIFTILNVVFVNYIRGIRAISGLMTL